MVEFQAVYKMKTNLSWRNWYNGVTRTYNSDRGGCNFSIERSESFDNCGTVTRKSV